MALHLVGVNDDAEEPLELPVLQRAVISAINRTFGADLDALAVDYGRRLAALEATVTEQKRIIEDLRRVIASLEQRQQLDDRRHSLTDIHAYRLKRDGVLPFLLDEAERRLADGIEIGVIAEELSLTPDELHRQLLIRNEWLTRHAMAGVAGGRRRE